MAGSVGKDPLLNDLESELGDKDPLLIDSSDDEVDKNSLSNGNGRNAMSSKDPLLCDFDDEVLRDLEDLDEEGYESGDTASHSVRSSVNLDISKLKFRAEDLNNLSDDDDTENTPDDFGGEDGPAGSALGSKGSAMARLQQRYLESDKKLDDLEHDFQATATYAKGLNIQPTRPSTGSQASSRAQGPDCGEGLGAADGGADHEGGSAGWAGPEYALPSARPEELAGVELTGAMKDIVQERAQLVEEYRAREAERAREREAAAARRRQEEERARQEEAVRQEEEVRRLAEQHAAQVAALEAELQAQRRRAEQQQREEQQREQQEARALEEARAARDAVEAARVEERARREEERAAAAAEREAAHLAEVRRRVAARRIGHAALRYLHHSEAMAGKHRAAARIQAVARGAAARATAQRLASAASCLEQLATILQEGTLQELQTCCQALRELGDAAAAERGQAEWRRRADAAPRALREAAEGGGHAQYMRASKDAARFNVDKALRESSTAAWQARVAALRGRLEEAEKKCPVPEAHTLCDQGAFLGLNELYLESVREAVQARDRRLAAELQEVVGLEVVDGERVAAVVAEARQLGLHDQANAAARALEERKRALKVMVEAAEAGGKAAELTRLAEAAKGLGLEAAVQAAAVRVQGKRQQVAARLKGAAQGADVQHLADCLTELSSLLEGDSLSDEATQYRDLLQSAQAEVLNRGDAARRELETAAETGTLVQARAAASVLAALGGFQGQLQSASVVLKRRAEQCLRQVHDAAKQVAS